MAPNPSGLQFRGERFLLGMPVVIYRSGSPDGRFVPRDRDGQLYLYYVGSGEQAIGIARLNVD